MRQRLKDFLVYGVLGIKDSPHRIALGVAVSVFVALTPTIPFQTVIMLAFCALLGANKIVGLPFIWITNPLTLVPIYGCCFVVGTWIVPGDYSMAYFLRGLNRVVENGILFSERLWAVWDLTLDFFWPLWMGCLLVGLLAGGTSYYFVYDGVLKFRRHREKLHQNAVKHEHSQAAA